MTRLYRLAPLALLLLVPLTSFAQKRAMDHDVYERWSYISDSEISKDGQWMAWREAPDTIGDGRVVIRSTNGRTTYIIERGDNPDITADGGFVIALVHPPYDSTRQAKIDGKKGDKLPKDSLAILNLASGARRMLGPVKSFAIPEDAGDLLAVLFDKEEAEEADSTETEVPDEEEEEAEESDSTDVDHKKTEGTRLLLHRLSSGEEFSFDFAKAYAFTDDGGWLAYTAEDEDGEADGAYAVSTTSGDAIAMKTGEGFYRQLAVSDDGRSAAFVSNADDFEAEQPAFTLYRSALGETAAGVSTGSIPDGWWVSEHASLDFSDSGERLYFGTAPRPEEEEDDERPDEEKVKLDVWSWTDPLLQPMQLVQRARELNRSYRAVAHSGGTVVQLATPDVPDVNVLDHGDGDVVIGSSNMPYRQEISWDSPGYTDYYAIDASTGEHRQVLEAIRSRASASPDGSHLAWWDGNELNWNITNTATGATVDISSKADVRFDNELHDWPYLPGSYREAGWTADGGAFLFYDDFDVWIATPDGGMLSNMTDGAGRAANMRYRYIELDPDADGIDLGKPLFLSAFNETTKASGFARLANGDDGPRTLVMDDVRFGFPRKAENADRLMMTRMSYTESPDLWVTDLDLGGMRKLSDANPQQAEYRWGTAELTHWVSVEGDPLDGILFKPDNFDASRKYPMMVYFYERNSDGLHSYRSPRAGGSSIIIPFYVSRDYVVFVPDIPYKVGYPGESAMNAVMPGITHLINQGFVDADRIGVQGHSWGGYQIAYMVTQTNLFAAAEAGAPVTNMTSAYGGIRWASGMSRMFQYEKTQSRIGGTLWNATLKYIHNSPVFQADKVETPIMYMHNDEDGAVPWYQGIEYFVALRRLGKPVWMLNYNGAGHGLRNYWARVDFAMRMQQFFDHYLKGEPAAAWITEGIPAVMKGKTMGYEPVGER